MCSTSYPESDGRQMCDHASLCILRIVSSRNLNPRGQCLVIFMHIESETGRYNKMAYMPERRLKPRIYDPFPALVKGLDQDGKPFEVKTIIDNLSFGGFYVRLMPCLRPGARIFLLIYLSHDLTGDSAPCVAVRGKVLRVDHLPGGVCGVAAVISRSRYFEISPTAHLAPPPSVKPF